MLTRTIGKANVVMVVGDITAEKVDAIVNAANSRLAGGGGVDGAIRRAGGPQILAECRELGGCETGDAKPTSAGELDAQYVIHAVGPVYNQRNPDESRRLLVSAYTRSIEVAVELGCRSVAFPAVSCGVYGYPPRDAARVVWQTLGEVLPQHPSIGLVRLVQFTQDTYDAYAESAPADTEA